MHYHHWECIHRSSGTGGTKKEDKGGGAVGVKVANMRATHCCVFNYTFNIHIFKHSLMNITTGGQG